MLLQSCFEFKDFVKYSQMRNGQQEAVDIVKVYPAMAWLLTLDRLTQLFLVANLSLLI